MKILDTALGAEVAPDWSCYAAPTTEAGPARTVTFSLAMSVAALLGNVEGLTVDVFFSPSTLGDPAETLIFHGGKATAELAVPEGVASLSAHVHALTTASAQLDVVEMREYDLRIPASGVVEATSVLSANERLAQNLALMGGTEQPDRANLTSEVRDCQGHDVGGAQFELVDAETGAAVETNTSAEAPRSVYSRFALPDPACTYTTTGRSEWFLFNAPVNVVAGAKTRSYQLRLKGRMRAEDRQPTILGEREIELSAGATTLVRLYRQNDRCEVISGGVQRCR